MPLSPYQAYFEIPSLAIETFELKACPCSVRGSKKRGKSRIHKDLERHYGRSVCRRHHPRILRDEPACPSGRSPAGVETMCARSGRQDVGPLVSGAIFRVAGRVVRKDEELRVKTRRRKVRKRGMWRPASRVVSEGGSASTRKVAGGVRRRPAIGPSRTACGCSRPRPTSRHRLCGGSPRSPLP